MKPNKNATKLTKYQPPMDGRHDFDGLRLDFSERTIPVGPKVREALKNLASFDPTIYPEYSGELEAKIADYAGVDTENIVVTNGSDQGLSTIFKSYASEGDRVLLPDPTFPMIPHYATLSGSNLVLVRYGADLEFPVADYENKLKDGVKLAAICNPNNPTGGIIDADLIKKWADQYPETLFLVDEAYYEFSGVTAASFIKELPNIIVTRTLSKAFGLAGVRVGYIIADPKVAEVLRTVASPYDINMVGYVLGKAAIDDIDDMRSYANEAMSAKEHLEKFFTGQKVKFYPSSANFMLFEDDIPEQFVAKMKQNGILLRFQKKLGKAGMVRISFGTLDQIEQFIETYAKVIK